MKLSHSGARRIAPIRVLFIAHDSGMFGAQRMLLTLLQGIDPQQVACRVVVPWDGEFTDEVHRLGIESYKRQMVRWIPEAAKLADAGRWKYTKKVFSGLRERAWAIARLVVDHQIEVVYTNTAVCLEGAVAARMARIPHIWHIHEPVTGNPELEGVFPSAVHARAIGALSERVIFCSHNLAALYPSLKQKASVVLNGVVGPLEIDRNGARSVLCAKFGLPETTRLVAIVGAIQPRKDHGTFVAAAARIAAECEDAAFVIVGSGDQTLMEGLKSDVLGRGLVGRVHIIGWWPGSIYEVLAAVDVLVISSIQESFGLSAIEALAVETPVVATRCGGPEEILRDGVDGVLVPVGDAVEMSRAVLKLLNDSEIARAYGRAGRLQFEAAFSAEQYVRGITQEIEEVAAGSQ